MILTGPTIRRLGIIEPHEPRTQRDGMTYGESLAGYDIRLAEAVEVIQGYTTLGVSLERFAMPRNVLGRVADKSTWARRGLQVQNTIIEPGWEGWLTLELTYAPLVTAAGRGLRINAGAPIAQVIFEFTDAVTAGYDGKYQHAACIAQVAILEG